MGMWQTPDVSSCDFDHITQGSCDLSQVRKKHNNYYQLILTIIVYYIIIISTMQLPPDEQATQLEELTSVPEDISAQAAAAVAGVIESLASTGEVLQLVHNAHILYNYTSTFLEC